MNDDRALMERARAQARKVSLPVFAGEDTPPRRVAREEALAAMIAAGGRAPLAAAQALARLVDALLERVLASGPPSACSRGCAWCCRSYVAVTAPEAILAVGWARKNLTPAALAAVRARAKSNAKRSKGAGPMGYPRQGCAFLVDEACSIHPVRPANCRAVHSSDAAACKMAFEAKTDDEVPPIPMRLDALEHGNSMLLGYQEALARAKVDANVYELQHLVHLLLSDPHVVDRWAAGDRNALRAARARE